MLKATRGLGGLEVDVVGNAMIMGKNYLYKTFRHVKLYLSTVIKYMHMKFHAAPLAEDCVAGPSRQDEGVVSDGEETVEQPSRFREGTRRPRARRENVSHEDHPFLTLQQAGFNMLERELSRLHHSLRRVNTRLSRLEMLLLPLGRIANSMERLADAVERITPATSPAITPPSPRSSLSTRSMSTLRFSTPEPSRRPSSRGASRLRTRGGRRGPV